MMPIYNERLACSTWNSIPYRWKVRRGYVSSVKIFRRLKVSSNSKKFVTFHRRKHLTNFEISYFSKNIISEKRYRYIFLIHSFFSFSTTMSMSISISIIVFSSSWKLYPLVAITSGFRMDNIPVINRLTSSLCYIPSEPCTAEGIEHRLIRIGNAKESLTQIVRFKSYTFEFIVRKLKRSNSCSVFSFAKVSKNILQYFKFCS